MLRSLSDGVSACLFEQSHPFRIWGPLRPLSTAASLFLDGSAAEKQRSRARRGSLGPRAQPLSLAPDFVLSKDSTRGLLDTQKQTPIGLAC